MPEHDDEDLILERLREATSGESTARQLRRRYDLLRRDYEVLIDRLAELEERLSDAPPAAAVAAEPRPVVEAAATLPAAGQGLAADLMERMMQPLLTLQAEYAQALAAMQGLVGGLETVTHGAMKGQRGSTTPPPPPPPAPLPEASDSPPATRIGIDVHAPGFGDLLDFQEKLAAVSGVARVSISAIDSERATFVVDLGD